MTIIHFGKVSTLYPWVVISSLAKWLEKSHFCHSYTSFGAWPRDHYMLSQRFTIDHMPGLAKVVPSTLVMLRLLGVVLSAKTHRRALTDNTRARRPGASIRRPCNSQATWCWDSLGMSPDLYLVSKVFDVLQLVSCINRHVQTLVWAIIGSPADSCIDYEEPMATQRQIGSKHPSRGA
jgi:hypothetical protein